MHAGVRYAPLGALALLILLRALKPGLLGESPFDQPYLAWITWWGLLVTILIYWSAWIVTPHVVQGFNTIARYRMLPPVIAFGGLIVLIWTADTIWNSVVVAHICGSCPRARMLAGLTTILTGVP